MPVSDFRDSIIRAARARGIDPSFVAGIMQIESGGNPSAGIGSYAQWADGSWHPLTAYAQGVGLMQVIPVEAPGNWTGRPHVAQLLDPEFSIDYGSGILADDFIRCGSKEYAACAYFAGHCIPTGATDGSGASDFTYIARAMASEQLFLDYNSAPEDDIMQRINGVSHYFEGRDFSPGEYQMNVEADFPGLPAAARMVRLEIFIRATPAGLFILRDGNANPSGFGYAGQASRYAVIDAFLAPLPEFGGRRGLRFSVGPAVHVDRIGILGWA